jgi:hypothetical protein
VIVRSTSRVELSRIVEGKIVEEKIAERRIVEEKIVGGNLWPRLHANKPACLGSYTIEDFLCASVSPW